MRLLNDFSVSALVAGFVTVLVGFTSSAVIVFQGAQAVGANPAEIASRPSPALRNSSACRKANCCAAWRRWAMPPRSAGWDWSRSVATIAARCCI